jgi:hypothetical protein
MESFSGTIIDQAYRVCALGRRLADADVYCGEPIAKGPPVAIAFLRTQIAESEEDVREAFEREGRALCRFTHPGVADVFDCGVHGDRPYVVTSLVAGEKLSSEVAALRNATDRAVRGVSTLYDALDAAREAGLVHGELTNDSLLVEPDGRVVIVDLAVVRLMRAILRARGEEVAENHADDVAFVGELGKSLMSAPAANETVSSTAVTVATPGMKVPHAAVTVSTPGVKAPATAITVSTPGTKVTAPPTLSSEAASPFFEEMPMPVIVSAPQAATPVDPSEPRAGEGAVHAIAAPAAGGAVNAVVGAAARANVSNAAQPAVAAQAARSANNAYAQPAHGAAAGGNVTNAAVAAHAARTANNAQPGLAAHAARDANNAYAQPAHAPRAGGGATNAAQAVFAANTARAHAQPALAAQAARAAAQPALAAQAARAAAQPLPAAAARARVRAELDDEPSLAPPLRPGYADIFKRVTTSTTISAVEARNRSINLMLTCAVGLAVLLILLRV